MGADWHAWELKNNGNTFQILFQTTKQLIVVHLNQNETYNQNENILFDDKLNIAVAKWEGDDGFLIENKEVNSGFGKCFITIDQRVIDDFKQYIQQDTFRDHMFHVDASTNNTTNINSSEDPGVFEESLSNASSQSSHPRTYSANKAGNDPIHFHISEYGNSIPNNRAKDPTQGGGKRRTRRRKYSFLREAKASLIKGLCTQPDTFQRRDFHPLKRSGRKSNRKTRKY
jgi:hypothetical protein